MGAIYPYRWNGQFENEAAVLIAREEWQEALADLSNEQIKRGLDFCRKQGKEFPPSIPEFRKMCFPNDDEIREELDILSDEEAYQMVLRKDLSNDVVSQAHYEMDKYYFNHQAERNEAKKYFLGIYRNCVDKTISEHKRMLALPLNQQRKEQVKKIVAKQNPLYANGEK